MMNNEMRIIMYAIILNKPGLSVLLKLLVLFGRKTLSLLFFILFGV